MKARAIEGKTIRKVHQTFWKESHTPSWTIESIEFTDGTFLRFTVL